MTPIGDPRTFHSPVVLWACQTHSESILATRATNVFTNAAQLRLIGALAETNFARADAILKDMSVDFPGTNNGTVLCWQANVGNFDAFEYLLKKGANPGRVVTDTYSTMELCAKQEDPRLLQAAIVHGGRINTIGYFTRQTPIYAAIIARRRINVEILVQNGAYLNVSDPTGITPLIWASECRAFDLVVLLLKHGADPQARDNKGFNALQVLREVNPKPGDPLYDSYREAISLLEAKRRDVSPD